MMALCAPIDLNYSKLNYTAMKHFNLLKTLLLLCALIVGSLSSWAEDVTYKLTIDALDFNATSYAANNNEKTSDAVCTTDNSKTYEVKWTSNQVMKNGNNMQWQKSKGYIYNSTDLGTITDVTVTSSAGSFTTYYGTKTQPSSDTTVGGGYFKTSVGGATGTTSKIEITFTISEGDTRAAAGISFTKDVIEKTWGDSFTGQVLTNPNSVDVTYSSTDESVATVNSTGMVTMLKAGTTTIKAIFAGDEAYKAAVASYTLTINKATANLSYDKTLFDVDLNDDSFVAPTLNNPNNLTVTYASDNKKIAVVDDNTGELLLVTTAEGTVKITASFDGNDNFYSGKASYTITITDPNKKGTKNNPYTVAEIKNSKSTESGIYVVGYIVGNYDSKNPVNPATLDTNLALADNADETAGSKTIPVELPKGSMREDWGPKSNNLIGYKVLVKGNGDTYFSTSGIKKVTEISAVSVPVSITAAGFATYAGDFGLDFSGLDVKAYKATVSGTTITFDKVTEVPAGEGVLLQGEGTFEVPVKSVDAWAADDNAFVRGTGAAVATGVGPYNYILNKVNGVVGFYKANGQTVAKNRAYLQSATAAARISLNFDEETTGISEVVKSDASNKVFDLQGRHIAQPTKGLYIMNGRKVLVK